MSVNALLEEFKVKAATPKQQLAEYKAQGKKVVGVLPYYAPEELVYAAGIVPMGMWGSNTKTISRAKEYCATFYCTIAQLALEMLLDGTMDQLDGIITPTICDNPKLLSIFEENNIAIAADDVAHETRSFRVDAPEDELDPVRALAKQFANIDYEVLLYDPESNKNRRGEFVANMVKESGAQGLVLFMQQFCDPEEMEYPYLKKALNDAGVPHIKLGIDQQMRDFGQASTAIQAFADVLALQK